MQSPRNSGRKTSVCLVIFLCLAYGLQVSRANPVVGASCSGELPGSKYPNAENCRTYIVCNTGVYELWYCPSGFYNPIKYECDLDYKCTLDNLPGATTIIIDDTTSPNIITTLYNEWLSTTSNLVETTTEETAETSSSTSISTESIVEGTTLTFTDATEKEDTDQPDETTTWNPTEVSSSSSEEEHNSESTTSFVVTTSESATETTTSPEISTVWTEPSTSAPDTTQPTTTTSTISTPLPTTSVPLPLDPYSCPTTDSFEPIFLSHKQNCEKYYLCYHSKPIELRCMTGMYWNGETKMCDYPKNVKCPTDGNTDANPLPKCNSAGLYSMPHPSRCEYFIMCMDGLQTIQQCDAFHRWDVIDQRCVIKDRATCILDITDPDRKDK